MTRLVVVATRDLLTLLQVFFHITTLARLKSIVLNGLKPGHLVKQGGRVDIHLGPFPPFDDRNRMMAHKLQNIKRTGEQ